MMSQDSNGAKVSEQETQAQTQMNTTVVVSQTWKRLFKKPKLTVPPSTDLVQDKSALYGSFTAGVMDVLLDAMQHNKSELHAGLCCRSTMHCATIWKDLTWGCGYRNIQHILSSLRASDKLSYTEAFVSGDILSIAEIQAGIEQAWQDGFDIEGAGQLSWKLLGTKKWIGTTEAYAFLTHRGYNCQIVQFTGTNPAAKLMHFCEQYFILPTESVATDRSVFFTGKHPLYFQHQGHSRTIVGFVRNSTDCFLVLFDPAKRVSQAVRNLADHDSGQSSSRKRRLASTENGIAWSAVQKEFCIMMKSLKKKEYQVLQVDGHLNVAQMNLRKIIRPYSV